MKVKVGHFIFDSEEEPILLILNEQDKHNISQMIPEAYRYCSYPDSISPEVALQFMYANATKVKTDPSVLGELIYLD